MRQGEVSSFECSLFRGRRRKGNDYSSDSRGNGATKQSVCLLLYCLSLVFFFFFLQSDNSKINIPKHRIKHGRKKRSQTSTYSQARCTNAQKPGKIGKRLTAKTQALKKRWLVPNVGFESLHSEANLKSTLSYS